MGPSCSYPRNAAVFCHLVLVCAEMIGAEGVDQIHARTAMLMCGNQRQGRDRLWIAVQKGGRGPKSSPLQRRRCRGSVAGSAKFGTPGAGIARLDFDPETAIGAQADDDVPCLVLG